MHVVKGVTLLTVEYTDHGNLDGFMSTMIAILYFGTVYALEAVGQGTWFRPWVRGILSDYAYPVSEKALSIYLVEAHLLRLPRSSGLASPISLVL